MSFFAAFRTYPPTILRIMRKILLVLFPLNPLCRQDLIFPKGRVPPSSPAVSAEPQRFPVATFPTAAATKLIANTLLISIIIHELNRRFKENSPRFTLDYAIQLYMLALRRSNVNSLTTNYS